MAHYCEPPVNRLIVLLVNNRKLSSSQDEENNREDERGVASAYCRRLTLINRPRRTLAIAVVKKKQLEVGRYATDKCRLGCERNGTQFIQDRCTVVCQLDISVIANVISDSKSKTINELTSTHRHCHIHYPYPMREGKE